MAAVRLPFFLFLFLLLLLSLFPFSCLSLSEAEALLKLKKSFTNGDIALSSWVSNQSPCQSQWVGVICSKDTVSGLRLTNMGLSGNIDIEALVDLDLRAISFVDNHFTGPIPEFNKLRALRALFLSNNQFSGEIPNDFFSSLKSIKKIWLDQNKFTGKIPESLTKITNLIELHLENNQFSGLIPNLPSKITSFSLSNNILEGEIPTSLANQPAEAFVGNVGLCGKPVGKECTEKDKQPPQSSEIDKENPTSENNSKETSPPPASRESNSSPTTIIVGSVIAGSFVLFLLFVIFIKRRRGNNTFSRLGKEKVGEVVEAHAPSGPSPNMNKSTESISRKGGDSKRGSTHGNKSGMSDIVMVNDEKGSFGLADLMKAAAEVLGNGGTSSTYKAVMCNGLSVVVKRMREMNVLGRDGFDEEIRRFGGLKHKNILTPLAYHYRKEEKLLVSEYIPKGSLSYVLHGDRGSSHAELNWPIRLKIIKGVARGLGFLHTVFKAYDVPHGNLKSSNILLDDDHEPLLNDYAFQPLMNPNHAPQAMFAYKSPEFLKNKQVTHTSDVYCLGIIILEVITGKFPSQYLNNGNGGTDVVEWVLTAMSEGKEDELLDPEIANLSNNSVKEMLKLLKIGATCVKSDPDQWLEMEEAIRKIEEVRV